jgi:hypothetical protein
VIDGAARPRGWRARDPDHIGGASGWPVAVGLLVAGLVVNSFARLIVGR